MTKCKDASTRSLALALRNKKKIIMNALDRMMNQAKESLAAVKAQRDPKTFTLQALANPVRREGSPTIGPIVKRSKSAGAGDSIPLSIPKPLSNNTQVIIYLSLLDLILLTKYYLIRPKAEFQVAKCTL